MPLTLFYHRNNHMCPQIFLFTVITDFQHKQLELLCPQIVSLFKFSYAFHDYCYISLFIIFRCFLFVFLNFYSNTSFTAQSLPVPQLLSWKSLIFSTTYTGLTGTSIFFFLARTAQQQQQHQKKQKHQDPDTVAE